MIHLLNYGYILYYFPFTLNIQHRGCSKRIIKKKVFVPHLNPTWGKKWTSEWRALCCRWQWKKQINYLVTFTEQEQCSWPVNMKKRTVDAVGPVEAAQVTRPVRWACDSHIMTTCHQPVQLHTKEVIKKKKNHYGPWHQKSTPWTNFLIVKI